MWLMHLTRKLRMVHTSALFKSFPILYHRWMVLAQYLLFSQDNKLICQPTFRTEYFPIGTHIQADFNVLNINSIREFTSAFNVIYATSSYPFSSPNRLKHPPVYILEYNVPSQVPCKLFKLDNLCIVLGLGFASASDFRIIKVRRRKQFAIIKQLQLIFKKVNNNN